MAKRLLSCSSQEMMKLSKKEFMEAIAGSEGRILAAETIGVMQPMLGDVTNAEFVASMGADMIILNLFDVNAPVIQGLPDVPKEETVRELKRLTGRKIGINLEPVDPQKESMQAENMWQMTSGRKATVENVKKAIAMGVDYIVLTGNPGMGVTNTEIVNCLKKIKEAVADEVVLIAGKMHGAGILAEGGENIITKKDVDEFILAGADVILMPAPGTVPGITMEYIRSLVSFAHSKNVLTMTAIGTSQEGADVDTIKQIALMCKMTGTDIHHIGDTGYAGMALPENIQAYSVAIRGIRHTYHRMAQSINR